MQQKYDDAIREQDRTLDDIEKGLDKINAIGSEIHRIVSDEDRLLIKLDHDMDGVSGGTHSARKKMREVMKGTSSHIILIIGLVAVVAVLAYFLLR